MHAYLSAYFYFFRFFDYENVFFFAKMFFFFSEQFFFILILYHGTFILILYKYHKLLDTLVLNCRRAFSYGSVGILWASIAGRLFLREAWEHSGPQLPAG
jgi:hypothetical protein